MTVGGIHHLAVVVRSIEESVERYQDLFGWQPEAEPFTFDPQRVRLCFLAAPDPSGSPRIELVQPTEAESGVGRFLATRGEGLHHVCLLSDDLPADLAALAAAEAELIDREPRPGAHGRVAFVHPRTLNGVLWELLQTEPGR
ncbi:MAG TPA: VOC family protein [Candidatus Limnocylindria bacterium]|nr:VOC family protein [Candidatus Limnocylindria bacterium]